MNDACFKTLVVIFSLLHVTQLTSGEFQFRHHFIDADLPGSQWGQTALIDVDRDGDLDFITGRTRGDIFWYEFDKENLSWAPHLLGRDSPSDVGGITIDVERLESGATSVRCPDDLVPRGRLDLKAALDADDERAKGLCRSRAYLYEHMTPEAREAFEPAFVACEIGKK